jgi:hypothetical protein
VSLAKALRIPCWYTSWDCNLQAPNLPGFLQRAPPVKDRVHSVSRAQSALLENQRRRPASGFVIVLVSERVVRVVGVSNSILRNCKRVIEATATMTMVMIMAATTIRKVC